MDFSTPFTYGKSGALDIIENTDSDGKARPDPKHPGKTLPALPYKLVSRDGKPLQRFATPEAAADPNGTPLRALDSSFSKLRGETVERFARECREAASAKLGHAASAEEARKYAEQLLASGIVTLYPVAKNTASGGATSKPSALGKLFAK